MLGFGGCRTAARPATIAGQVRALPDGDSRRFVDECRSPWCDTGAFHLFTKTTGLLIVPLWVAMMVWVVARDAWPAWTAEDPPRVTSAQWIDASDAKV